MRLWRAASTAAGENDARGGGIRDHARGRDEGGDDRAVLLLAVFLATTDQGCTVGGAGTELLEENTARRSLNVSCCCGL